jgi:hypothetical protein
MRFEVLRAVKISMLVFWVVMPCGLVGRYQRFGGKYCFILQVTPAMKMKAGCSIEALVSTDKSTLCCNPEHQQRHNKGHFGMLHHMQSSVAGIFRNFLWFRYCN